MALNYRLIFHPVHDGWQVPFSEHTMVTAPHELKLTKQTIFDLSFSMAAGGAAAMPRPAGLDHHQQQLEWLRFYCRLRGGGGGAQRQPL